MRDNEKNIHKMGAILQAKKAPEGEVKGAYENSGFSSGRCAAEVTKCEEKKSLTESDVLRALYHMYCAAAYKGNVTMSSETAIGLYNFFNSQKAEIEELQKRLAGQKKALFEQQSYTAEKQSEIERLKRCVKTEDEVRAIASETIQAGIKVIKAEAIKEFAERLIEKKNLKGSKNEIY